MPDQKITTGSPTPSKDDSSSKDDKPRLITAEENARTGWSEDQPPGPSEFMKQQAIARLTRDRRPAATGNLADLDRLGGLALGQDVRDAFVLPAGYSKEDVTTPAERDAALGIYNTETARTGLVEAPPAPESGDGHTEPVVVDSGSQGPRIVEEGKGSSTSSADKEK